MTKQGKILELSVTNCTIYSSKKCMLFLLSLPSDVLWGLFVMHSRLFSTFPRQMGSPIKRYLHYYKGVLCLITLVFIKMCRHRNCWNCLFIIINCTSKQYVMSLYVTDHCICLCQFDSLILCWRSK